MDVKKVAEEILKKAAKISAADLVKILNKEKGETYAVNWTGATDKAVVKFAEVIQINRGKGFEDAIKCEIGHGGYFIYMPDFNIVGQPTKDSMLVFKCGDAIYIKE